jgi:hypothetical protein
MGYAVTSPVGLRPVGLMSEGELLAEYEALQRVDDRVALASPTTLARHLSHGYKRRAHLNVIGREMARMNAGEFDRLLIMTPPQVGKTVTAVVWGAMWWLALHPAHKIIIGSYGATLATDRGTDTRRLVAEIGDRYDLQLEPGSRQKSQWRVTTGGGVKSVGIRSGITGNPGDIAFVDDPHRSRADADSLRFRDAVDDWYSADLGSRLAPRAPLVLVMTTWHIDDLAHRVIAREGRVDSGGRWRVLVMPALCTDPENDPLGRAYGEPLPHPKIAPGDTAELMRHWNERRSSAILRDWHSLYQCNPQPSEGALLTEQLLRERRYGTPPPPLPPGVNRVNAPPVGPPYQLMPVGPVTAKPLISAVAVDPSGGGRDVAGVIGGFLGDDDRLYLTADESGVMSADDWGRAACELAMRIDADRIIYESNYGGDQAGYVIRTSWNALRVAELTALGLPDTVQARRSRAYLDNARYARPAPRVVGVHAKKGKRLRAEPISVQWIQDRIRTAVYLPDVESEWSTWQPTDSDSPGRLDASVYLAWSLLKAPADVTKGVKSATQVRRSSTSTPGGAPTIRRGGPGGAAGGRRA